MAEPPLFVFSEPHLECVYCLGICFLAILTYILTVLVKPIWWVILIVVALWILAIIGAYFLIRRAVRRKGEPSIEEIFSMFKSVSPLNPITTTTEVVHRTYVDVDSTEIISLSIALLRQIYAEIRGMNHLRIPHALSERWSQAENPFQDEAKGAPAGAFFKNFKKGTLLEKWNELDLFKAYQQEIDAAISAFNTGRFQESIMLLSRIDIAVSEEWMSRANAMVLEPLFKRLIQNFSDVHPELSTSFILFLVTDEIYYLIREVAIE